MAITKKATVTVEGGILVWKFADVNETEVRIDPEVFSGDIQQQAIMHGLKQKLSDSYAGAESAAAAVGRFNEVLSVLKSGMWNAGRSASGGIWVEALARAQGVDVEEARAVWVKLSDDQQKDVKAHKDVKLAKAQIDLERAQAKAAAEDNAEADEDKADLGGLFSS